MNVVLKIVFVSFFSVLMFFLYGKSYMAQRPISFIGYYRLNDTSKSMILENTIKFNSFKKNSHKYEAKLIPKNQKDDASKTLKIKARKNSKDKNLSNQTQKVKHIEKNHIEKNSDFKRKEYITEVKNYTFGKKNNREKLKKYNVISNNTNGDSGIQRNSSLSEYIETTTLKSSEFAGVNLTGINMTEVTAFLNTIGPKPKILPNTTCTTVVPNIVHFIFFSAHTPKELLFHHLMSVLSAIKIQQPDVIYFWYNKVPAGKWWILLQLYIKQEGINFVMKEVPPPDRIYGIYIMKPEHKADVQRLRCIEKYGGIYLDLDVLVIKPLAKLMCNNFTLGKEDDSRLNNGIIIAVKKSKFIHYWWQQYQAKFNPRGWIEASVNGATTVAREHPDLIHIEETSLNRPSYFEIGKIYSSTFSWKEKYCVHLWYRFHGVEYNPDSIRNLTSALGEMYRYIWYDAHTVLHTIQ